MSANLHLHGGEAAMLTSVVDRMEASGVAARAGLADGWGTAHAVARFLARPIAIIPPGQAAAAMRDLPIHALRLGTMCLLIQRRQRRRALPVFDHLPAGCIAHLVTDAYSTPHIRPDEFIVVDTADRQVRHQETYVIEWHGGRRSVCEAVAREFNWPEPEIPRQGWRVRSISGLRGKAITEALDHARTASQISGLLELPMLGWCEGPFRSDDWHLESKLVGTVIGLYEPDFEGPVIRTNVASRRHRRIAATTWCDPLSIGVIDAIPEPP